MSKIRNGNSAEKKESQSVKFHDNGETEKCIQDTENSNIDTSNISSFSDGRLAVTNDEAMSGHSDNQDSCTVPLHTITDADEDHLTLRGSTGDENTLDHFDDLVSESVLLQAVVFIEDAYHYRSIDHKIEAKHLCVYRKYHSGPVIIFRYAVILLLHLLAFVEYPSSLTKTSDPRTRGERVTFPCWLTQFVEFICLMLLLTDNILKMYLIGRYYFVRHKWDMGAVLLLIISLVDWTVSCGMSCQELVRFRRLLRPYFILQNSSLMKKIVNCLRRTLPEVMSILLLLSLHLYVFTLFGMLLFPVYELKVKNNTTEELNDSTNSTNPGQIEASEGNGYFRSWLDSLISLLVLLTTANNPDVMMPAYSRNRFSSIFFILYLIIGLYCFMNMLLAVIYNQFRGYFLSSMQGSLLRRRLGIRGAFEVLQRKNSSFQKDTSSTKNSSIQEDTSSGQAVIGSGVGGGIIKTVIDRCLLPKHVKAALKEDLSSREDQTFSVPQFQELFCSLDTEIIKKQRPAVRWFTNPKLRLIQRVFIHKYFNFFGMGMAFINLVIISVQLGTKYEASFQKSHSTLRVVNFTFAIYYVLEQLAKLWAFGWRRYLSNKGNIYDAVVTAALLIGEIVWAAMFGIPYFPKSRDMIVYSSSSVMWNVFRIINILIMVRMLKIIPYVKSMSIVAMVLLDLMKNMKSFAGILVVMVYVFAIFGMELFQGEITYKPEFVNRSFACGSYEQLEYWANNFDDFFASLIVLWDIMVINNWHVFLEVFKNRTSPWSYLYFVTWWLLSVVLILNLFTALIMENFIMKWDRRHQINEAAASTSSAFEALTVSVHLSTVHSMFRDLLHEPAESDLLLLLNRHRYLSLEN